VAVSVDGHPDAVEEGTEHDDHFGVVGAHSVVAHDATLDPVLRQLAQELQGDVGHDLDMHPRVVVDLEPLDRVHVRHVPPSLDLRVGVHPLDKLTQLAVRARRHADAHALDRL
jgi:hypothetical protein